MSTQYKIKYYRKDGDKNDLLTVSHEFFGVRPTFFVQSKLVRDLLDQGFFVKEIKVALFK